MLEVIVKREGFGNVLAERAKRAAEHIGRGAEKYAMHVKSREIPMHEQRGKVGVGIQYDLCPIGADHVQAPHDPIFERITQHLTALGLTRPVNRFALNREEVRAVHYGKLWWGSRGLFRNM